MSAPITDLSSPARNIRILEQKFAHYAGYARREVNYIRKLVGKVILKSTFTKC